MSRTAAEIARAHIDLVDVVPAVGHVQKTVLGQWRVLLPRMWLVAAGLGAAELHDEGDVQVRDVRLIDLVERRIPLGIVGLVIGQPVARLALGILQAVERHLCRSQRRRQ